MTPEDQIRIEGTDRPAPGTGTGMLEERIRVLEERLRALQGGRAPGEARRIEPLFDCLVPSETRRHLRAAQREHLLALRSLVDAAIKRTEDRPASEARPRRPESVRID